MSDHDDAVVRLLGLLVDAVRADPAALDAPAAPSEPDPCLVAALAECRVLAAENTAMLRTLAWWSERQAAERKAAEMAARRRERAKVAREAAWERRHAEWIAALAEVAHQRLAESDARDR